MTDKPCNHWQGWLFVLQAVLLTIYGLYGLVQYGSTDVWAWLCIAHGIAGTVLLSYLQGRSAELAKYSNQLAELIRDEQVLNNNLRELSNISRNHVGLPPSWDSEVKTKQDTRH